MVIKKVFLMSIAILMCAASAAAKDGKSMKGEKAVNAATRQVLIVGLDDNVKSNYYYKGLIAEETGMKADQVDKEYNRIIAENIALASDGAACRFIAAQEGQVAGQVVNEIKVIGESEESYSDISAVPAEALQKTLDTAGADYMLVLNQHYLQWQETPLRTLFHIVSYTLYDRNKQELCRGNNYFTCMNLEQPDKLCKSSRKSAAKIAATVRKTLEEK